MTFITVNYLAVLIAAIVSMVIGALWYSQALFGKQWMKLQNFKPKDIAAMKQKGMCKTYALSFLATLVLTYVLATIIGYVKASTATQGASIGFLVWLGFVATISLNEVLWAKGSKDLYFLNNAHHLVSLVVSGAILAVL
tara:strand:- start:428 stop:844 length:417 start_codon:yes stop_codon:yes gene_type:complete